MDFVKLELKLLEYLYLVKRGDYMLCNDDLFRSLDLTYSSDKDSVGNCIINLYNNAFILCENISREVNTNKNQVLYINMETIKLSQQGQSYVIEKVSNRVMHEIEFNCSNKLDDLLDCSYLNSKKFIIYTLFELKNKGEIVYLEDYSEGKVRTISDININTKSLGNVTYNLENSQFFNGDVLNSTVTNSVNISDVEEVIKFINIIDDYIQEKINCSENYKNILEDLRILKDNVVSESNKNVKSSFEKFSSGAKYLGDKVLTAFIAGLATLFI